MEGGQSGAPGVPAVFPVVVRELKSNRGHVPTRHPAMVELTALAGMSVRKIVTRDLVFKVKLCMHCYPLSLVEEY